MTVAEVAQGISREAVEQISASKREPAWMRDKRLQAWSIFEALPMPTRQDEEWRRTDIRRLKLEELSVFSPPSGPPVESPLQLGEVRPALLRHQDSEVSDLTFPDELRDQGVIFTDLETAVREHGDLVETHFMTEAVRPDYNKFSALNAALWTGGTFLYVPSGVEVAMPVYALYGLSAAGAAIFTHTLLIVEPGARLTYVEEYASPPIDQLSLNAGVVEIFLRQGAHLTFVGLQDWLGQVFDISTQRALVGRDSQLDWLVIGTGNGLTKANIEAALNGAGARAQMLGILWGYEKQHTDYHTLQDHVAPHTTSDLLYKTALADEARSIFSGRIRVEKGAQGTDAYQANRNVLLSDKAAAFPSPNLEIEANEVRCTHGASIGRVDQDQVFYLMSRGLPRELATRMVVEGFFEEVLQREPATSIRDNLRDLIARKMERI